MGEGRLPAHVRPLVHERAAGVPPFAHEDSLLADPKAWPAAMTLGGKRCVLQITSSNSGVGSSHKTLATVWPGDTLNLRYQYRGARRDLVFGPSYFWDGNGRLWARGWTEPDSGALRCVLYTTNDAGALLGYHLSSRKFQPTSTDTLLSLSEYFDRKGSWPASPIRCRSGRSARASGGGLECRCPKTTGARLASSCSSP